jgi:ubiquinone/menaquinone biosynthesis C-methylase UbiE
MNKKETKTRKEHWEQIYQSKKDNEVSWYQDIPKLSLELIHSLKLARNAEIIDIGGGNSNLAAKLLELGYGNLSILDISAKALERTQLKLGDRAKLVQWIVSDVLFYKPSKKFDLWHDRAAFHFLTKKDEIKKYAVTAGKLLKPSGYLIVSAFSITGPKKCSGLDITQYSEESMRDLFEKNFEFIKSLEEVHMTPMGTQQNFIYCIFRRYPPK